jgi:hypothetical protein
MSNPCLNNGTCARNDTTGARNCTCTDGWQGARCESKQHLSVHSQYTIFIDISTCADYNPCNNGGTCARNDTTGLKNCTCTSGWMGDRCQGTLSLIQKISYCRLLPWQLYNQHLHCIKLHSKYIQCNIVIH